MSAPAKSRARLPIDERRAQLLQLGRSLFVERSYDEISIDDIAAAAGVSKGLLYHYFPSKRSFYVETVREAAAELIARTDTPADLAPELRVQRGLDAYLEYVAENAAAYRTLLTSGIGVDAEIATLVEDTRRALVDRILRDLGPKPPPALRVALRGWIGFVEGASLEWIERKAPPRTELRDLMAAMLLSVVTMMGALPARPKKG